jgi:hypothetical protein
MILCYEKGSVYNVRARLITSVGLTRNRVMILVVSLCKTFYTALLYY